MEDDAIRVNEVAIIAIPYRR